MEDTMTDRYAHHDATRDDLRIQAKWARRLAVVYAAALILLVAFVAASHMIADPLRLLDCSPVSDGGAAVVVTTADRAGKGGKRPARVIGAGFSTTHLHLSAATSLTRHGAGLALDRALSFASRSPRRVDRRASRTATSARRSESASPSLSMVGKRVRRVRRFRTSPLI